MKKLEEYVRSIPDFPEPGVIFRDVTSILQDADGLRLAVDSLQELLEGVDFDVIVGTESRGFIFGVPVAYNLHKPFVPVRKKASCPARLWKPAMIWNTAAPIHRKRSIRQLLARLQHMAEKKPTRQCWRNLT